MARSRQKRSRGAAGLNRFQRNPEFFRVEPTDAGWPQEWRCMNVMCRARFWREFGQSEFCPACAKMLHKDGK